VFGANDSRSGSPELLPVGHDTVVLIGRVGSDDFAAVSAAHNDARRAADILLAEYRRLRALNALYALSYHSQLLAAPEFVPALAKVARAIAADTAVWLATTGEVADWWRGRAQLEARVRPRADGFDVTVSNHGDRLVGGAVVRVDMPALRPLGKANVVLLPSRPGSVRLLLPPTPGKTTRVYAVDYAGARKRSAVRPVRARATPRAHKRFWWLPF
jgi:hypothetical protein